MVSATGGLRDSHDAETNEAGRRAGPRARLARAIFGEPTTIPITTSISVIVGGLAPWRAPAAF
jgi:hypothetical protein